MVEIWIDKPETVQSNSTGGTAGYGYSRTGPTPLCTCACALESNVA